MCERCTFHFHTSCMALGATAIAEVVEDLLRWFCPACRRLTEDQDASSFNLASGDAEDTRSSGMVEDVEEDVEDVEEDLEDVKEYGAGDASETGLSHLLGHAKLSPGMGTRSPGSEPSLSPGPGSFVTDHSSGVINLGTPGSSVTNTSSTSTDSGTRRRLGAAPAGGCQTSPGADSSSPAEEPSPLSSPSIKEPSLPCSHSTKDSSFPFSPATKETSLSPNTKESSLFPYPTPKDSSLPSSPTTKDSSLPSTPRMEDLTPPSTPCMRDLTPPCTPATREVLSSTAEVLALAALQDTMSPLPLFATPRLPVWKKPRPKLELAASPGLAAKPGKAWRRSIAVAAKADYRLPGVAARPSLAASRSSFYVVPRPVAVPAVEEVPEAEEVVEDTEERRLFAACPDMAFDKVYSEDVMKGSEKVSNTG